MRFGIKSYIVVLIGMSCSAGWAGGMGKTCVEKDGCRAGLGVGAELLYLQADFSSLAYIGSVTTRTAETYEEDFYAKKFKYGPGFKLEAYYNFTSGNDINLNWYHYQYTTHQTLPSGINVYDSPFLGEVSLQLKPRWDAVNLEFGHHISLDSRNELRFHGGIQHAEIILDNKTTSTIVTIGSGIARNNHSTYSGTGIRGGADYAYDVGHGVAVNFKGAASLLLGHHSFNRQYLIYTGLKPGVNGNYGTSTSIITALDGRIGGSYTYATTHHYFTINAGWMIVNYYNPIEVADSYHHGRTKESNFALSGPYVGLKWSGDGPS